MMSKEDFAKCDAEVCKIESWRDQIAFGIFVCAECGKSTCECESHELIAAQKMAERVREIRKLKDKLFWSNDSESFRQLRLLSEEEDELVNKIHNLGCKFLHNGYVVLKKSK